MSFTTENDVCRLCTNHGHNYHPIFNGNTNSIIEKIHSCLPIVINPHDKLPAHICSACLDALNVSDKLRTQSLQSDMILRKQLEVHLMEDIKQEKDELNFNTETEDMNREDSEIGQGFCKDELNLSDDSLDHINDKNYIENVFVEVDKINAHSDNEIEDSIVEDPIDIKGENIFHSENISTAQSEKAHCDICNVTIVDELLMQEHIKFHQPRSMFCARCYRTLPSPYDLYIHRKTIHNMWTNCQIKWFCEKCEQLTDNPDIAINHMEECTKRAYPCKYCNQNFAYKKEFLLHQKKKHYDSIVNDPNFEKFKCQLCDKSYVDKSCYRQHVLRNHPATENETNKCNYCQKQFSSHRNLKDHIERIHTERQICKCNVCPETFSNEKSMKLHKRKHERLNCGHCAKYFDKLKTLNQHLLDVHNTPVSSSDKFICQQCGLSFRRAKQLQDHQNAHAGERLYACETCNITFSTSAAHLAHEQLHKNPAVFCDYCKRKFYSKRTLEIHILTHKAPEDWQYRCEICDMKFLNNRRLQWHWRKNRDTHLHSCDVCGIEFLGMHRLRQHKRQKHNIAQT